MQLIGRYTSPFVRRVGVSLNLLGIPFEHKPISVMTDRERIAEFTPLVRVPVLVLDDGEVLIDSAAILDHLDEIAGPERALVPPSGASRREVLRLTAMATGIMDKAVAGYYERTRRPPEKFHQPIADQVDAQVAGGFKALDEAASRRKPYLTGEWLTQADVSTVCAFDFVRGIKADLVEPGLYPNLEGLSALCEALPAFVGASSTT
jgi:glutathione S-transferase